MKINLHTLALEIEIYDDLMINLEAFFNISYGMYIVCSGNGLQGNGFICNSVIQVTAEPPKFAVCCNKNNYTANLITNSGAFSISALNQDTPMPFIGTFGYKSGKDLNKFEGLNIKIGESGIPIVLNEAISIIECKLEQTIDVGSHLLFIGEAINSESLINGTPLTYTYYREIKNGIAPKNAPTYIDKSIMTKKEVPLPILKYKCSICGYVFDSSIGDIDNNIEKGRLFENISEDWKCPTCGASKEDFYEL